MSNFDFTKEMTYGEKHLKKINFLKEKYNLFQDVTDLFGFDLDKAQEKYRFRL